MSPMRASTSAERLRLVSEAAEDAAHRAERLAREAEAKREKEEADRRMAKTSIENGWGLFMSSRNAPRSVRECVREGVKRHTTAFNYQSYYRRFAEWLEAERPDVILLSDVSESDAETFLDSLAFADGTFNKYLQFFRLLYDVLRGEGWLPEGCNPFSRMERRSGRHHSKKPFSQDEVARLMGAATGELRFSPSGISPACVWGTAAPCVGTRWT